jgi:hypothetical protein
MRQCHSCAARPGEAAFPHPTRGQMCCACIDERERDNATPRAKEEAAQRRAQYRAAFRHRARQPQTDLVDLVVPPP